MCMCTCSIGYTSPIHIPNPCTYPYKQPQQSLIQFHSNSLLKNMCCAVFVISGSLPEVPGVLRMVSVLAGIRMALREYLRMGPVASGLTRRLLRKPSGGSGLYRPRQEPSWSLATVHRPEFVRRFRVNSGQCISAPTGRFLGGPLNRAHPSSSSSVFFPYELSKSCSISIVDQSSKTQIAPIPSLKSIQSFEGKERGGLDLHFHQRDSSLLEFIT